MEILIGYVICINLMGFLAMGIDKERAKRHVWRISEKTLFVIAMLGGCFGTWLGMYLFRHKTKHGYFVLGMWAIMVLWALLAIVFFLDF